MKIIKVPFPKIEGLEVKSVTADLEKGYSVVEYGSEDTKEVEDMLLVPESIGIYKYNYPVAGSSGDKLYIGFNDSKQLLGFFKGVYEVLPNDKNNYHRVQCYLQPIKREELKVGDTVFLNHIDNELDLEDLVQYNKIVSKSECACADYSNNIELYSEDSNFMLDEHKFYKLIPLNE